MIKETHSDIFADLPDFSIIIQPVNCVGTAETGPAAKCRKNIKGWFLDYVKYCDWFKNGKPEELTGTFHTYSLNEKTKICSVFVIEKPVKSRPDVDMRAWEKALRKIENQTRFVNSDKKTNWILHIQKTEDGFFGEWPRLRELLDYFFANSPVELWIHE